MNESTKRIKTQGFTLLELLVVIAVIATLLSLAFPMLSAHIKRQESLTLRNHIQTFLKQGRQNAIVYQKTISLCVVDTNNQCVVQNGVSLLSFIDNNDNQQFDVTTDKLLEKLSLNPKYGVLKTGFALNKVFIQLSASNGLPLGAGNIKYCPNDNNNDNKFKVTFSKTGQVKVKTNADEPTEC